MKKIAVSLLLAAVASCAATVEPAGPPPAKLPAAISGMLQKDGIRVLDGKKVVMELWFRTTKPTGPKNTEDAISLTDIPQGSFLGVANFPEKGSDRRGQTVKPGVYTLRLGFFPPNGDHQGVAPQRDFLVLSRIEDDQDPSTTPAFEALMTAARKASGTPHPLVFSVWKSDAGKSGIAQEGESDWVLQAKIGDVPLAMIVVGKFEH